MGNIDWTELLMYQHSPNIKLEKCADVVWQNIPASTSNLTMPIGAVAIRPGESVLYYYASNVAAGSTTVAHTGLTPANMINTANASSPIVTQGYRLVNYPLGLAAGTQITFSKANFWGTHALFIGIRIINGFAIKEWGNVTVTNYTGNTVTGFNFGNPAANQVTLGYKKSIATIVAAACSSDSATTGIEPGFTNFGAYNNAALSFSIQGRHQAIFPTTPELFRIVLASNVANLHFLALRIVI